MQKALMEMNVQLHHVVSDTTGMRIVRAISGFFTVDSHQRGLLYEAATVILTRILADSALRAWGLSFGEKSASKGLLRQLLANRQCSCTAS
jgi:hypothetical protein